MTGTQSSINRTGETAREQAVNVLLGQLLRDRGVRARAERRSRGDAPDIRFELPSGDVVPIECKWEDGRADLHAQLDQRMVRSSQAAARVGVLYPADWLKQADDILDELAHTPNLEWLVRSSRVQAFADPPVREGTIDQFAEHRIRLRIVPQG